MELPQSRLLQWIQGLFVLNGAVWLLFCVQTLISDDGAFGLLAGPAGVILGLMFVNGVLLFALAWLAPRRNRWWYFFSVGYVGLNAVLSITDQVGFFDYLVFTLNLVLLGLNFYRRKTIKSENVGRMTQQKDNNDD